MFLKTWLTKYITFGFASAITLFPFVLVNPPARISKCLVRHERIHLCQQIELLVLPFFLIYSLEYLLRYLYFKSHNLAYRNISFEREAYSHENEVYYLQKRKPYCWVRYIFSASMKDSRE